MEIIVERHGSMVAGGSRFDPGAFRRIQHFGSDGEMISQPEINKDTRIPARLRGKGSLAGIAFSFIPCYPPLSCRDRSS
jgi:hypothetical protein